MPRGWVKPPSTHTPRHKRKQAPEKPRAPVASEISTGLGPSTPPRRHARGRFAPPAQLAPPRGHTRPPVRGEHGHDMPFDDWLHERMFHPKPKDELRVLGFVGYNALQKARENMRNYVYAMKHPQVRAQQGHLTQEEMNRSDSSVGGSFLTPEQEAAGRKAIGSHGLISPETAWETLGFRPTEELRGIAEHPLAALHRHEAQQARQLAEYRQTGQKPEMSIGIIPFGETPGARAGRTDFLSERAAKGDKKALAEFNRKMEKQTFNEQTLSNVVPGAMQEDLFPTAKRIGGKWVSKLHDGEGREVWSGADHAHKRGALSEALAQRAKHPPRLGLEVPKTPKKAVEVPVSTKFRISGGAPGKITSEERRVTYHGLSTWFPTSPSRPTAFAQRLIDRFSEHLSKPVDALRESQDWKRYRLGQLLTPASSRGRVPKVRATRVQRLGARRARGKVAQERRVLQGEGHFMGHRTNSGEQMAHAVWLQLPESHRNVEGLKLWQKHFLHHSLADLTDMSETGFAARVASYVEDATVRMSQEFKSGDVVSARRTQAEIADLKAVQQDLPGRISDVQDEIKKFDQLIAKPPKYNPDVADAAATLNQEAEEIMVREGLLDPEEAAIRAGKVSEGLGLKPTGEEIYVHHGLGPGKGAMGAGAGLGRLRPPAGAGQHLGLVLARSGRVRLSLEPVIEHWQQAQSYELQGIMRDDLAAMGTPLSEKPGFRPGPDDLLVNPEGRPKLRSWQRDPEVVALEESLDPEGFHIKNLEEALHSAIAEGADRDRLIQEAIDAGQLDQLKVVPRDVFNRYVGQYKDYATVVPGMEAVRKGADAVNSMIYLSLIYANPGYIPANLVQNFLMHFLQAGVFVPVDLARTIRILQKATAEGRGGRMQRLRDQLRSEIGHGPTVEAASNIKISRSIATHVAMIPDDPLRMSAFIHEAGRLGVIPKMSPVLRDKDITALENLLNDKNMRGRLNDVQDRAVQAMVDFERLGPKERAILKRVMFVWSWTRGGSRYPFRFALDHPGRSAVLAYLISGAPGAPQSVQDRIHSFMPTVQHGMPPWLEGAFHIGSKTIGGKTYPVILPTRQISPISQPWDIIQTAASAPGAQTVGQLLNPAIPAGWHILNKESPYGRAVGSYGEAAWQEWQRLQPAANLAGGVISPTKDTKLYPEDRTRWGRLKRSLRVVPYAVDLQEAEKARVRSGMTSTKEAALERFKSDVQHYLHHAPPKEILDEYEAKLDLEHRVRKEATDKNRRIDYFKAVKIAAEMIQEKKGIKLPVSGLKIEAQAHDMYLSYRAYLYPRYAAYAHYLRAQQAATRGAQSANG